MEILLSLTALVVASLSLYITYLFQNDDIKTEVQYAIDELIRYAKYYTWYNIYRKDVINRWNIHEYLVKSWTLNKTKYSKLKPSTKERKPSIIFIVFSIIFILIILAEVIIYISKLYEKLSQIFL